MNLNGLFLFVIIRKKKFKGWELVISVLVLVLSMVQVLCIRLLYKWSHLISSSQTWEAGSTIPKGLQGF